MNVAAGNYEIGIDTGGTFTDLVCRMAGQPTRILKVPSTPADPSEAIIDALNQAIDRWDLDVKHLQRLVHGTTVGTNAVLERKGAKIGLLATRGFEHVMAIGRQLRDPMYDLKPKAVVPNFLLSGDLRKGVEERIGPDGEVLTDFAKESARAAIKELVDKGVTSIVVSYLFSFINPAHERQTAEIIEAEFPGLHYSLSSEVDPNFREYERTLVTAFDGYVKPIIVKYLDRLTGRLKERGVDAPLQLMQSRGGVTSATVARQRPVRLFLSGPAGGVIGARLEGELAQEPNLITIDIGGTSSDIALIAEGKPMIVSEGSISGWPVRAPMVGVHAIGAGGGSIAWLDLAGGLRVGPHSAGANPGPACYGRGGTNATVTDASLVLGYLNPGFFAGGTLSLDRNLARDVIKQTVADPLGLTIEQAALGIHTVVNAQMAEGIRLVSIRQGNDPREFSLVPLGGGGPVHATALASELGINRIVIPRNPGVLAAAGLLFAPVEHEVSHAYACPLSQVNLSDVKERLVDLDQRAAELMSHEEIEPSAVQISYSAELCYIGQSFPLEVPLDVNADDPISSLYERFLETHERVFGHATRAAATIMRLRTVHQAPSEQAGDRSGTPSGGSGVPTPREVRRVIFKSGEFDCPVFRREHLGAGQQINGPTIIEQDDTTTVVEPGWEIAVLPEGPLRITRS